MPQAAASASPRRFRWGCSANASAADRRNLRIANAWVVVWTLVFLASLKIMETYGDDSLAVSAAALGAAALATVPFIRAYARFVRKADELTRLIHTRAMAVAFAVGFVIAIHERFLERVVSFLSLPPFPLKLADLIINTPTVMIVCYAVTVAVLEHRYSR